MHIALDWFPHVLVFFRSHVYRLKVFVVFGLLAGRPGYLNHRLLERQRTTFEPLTPPLAPPLPLDDFRTQIFLRALASPSGSTNLLKTIYTTSDAFAVILAQCCC